MRHSPSIFAGSFVPLAAASLAMLAACSTPAMPGDAGDVVGMADSADGGSDAATDGSGDAPPADASDVAVSMCEGVRRSFWTWDLTIMPPPDVELMAECRRATPHLYIYSTDNVWPTNISPDRVDVIARAFEDSTPANPSRGIWSIETEAFGMGPDVDNDPHVVLFYSDIGTFRGFTFDGFFRAIDESETDPHSNRTEMLHLDARPMNPVSEYMLGVVAHEFVHLLVQPYGAEDVWLSEMFGEAGMVMCGYLGDLRLARAFAARATSPLVVSGMGADYGPLFLFGTYLIERFGAPIIGEIARNPARGVPTVETALASRGTATFRDVFGDWTVANLVDAARPPHGYATFDITTEAAARVAVSGTAADGRAGPWAAQYVQLDLAATDTAVDVALTTAVGAQLIVHSAVYDPMARPAAVVAAHAVSASGATFTIDAPAARRRVALIVANAAATAADYRVTLTAR